MSRWFILLTAILLAGCNMLPGTTTTGNSTMVYEAPVTFEVKTGSLLAGTSIAYQGKTETGSAKVMLAGIPAPKQTADSVDWNGNLAPNVAVVLNTRVAKFDDKSVTLAGTARIQISGVDIKPGGTPPTTELMEFLVPVVTYTLAKNQTAPGTNISYVGSTPDGAQFAGVEGYPYRKQFDSVQYVGRLAPKVFLQLDLRVVNFSDANATLAGPAHIWVENP